ncbi:MAG TPA: hypothetical protein VN636_19230 [Acidimicrobiia bacterium]|nr:hypothetical protein [Acidimicrobiia bacterium]
MRKTLTDAGYIAVGLGVLGFQQVQIRGRELGERAVSVRVCVRDRARDARDRVEHRSRDARDQAQTQVRATITRSKELGGELTKRVEPVVGQVHAQINDLPERVVQAWEPVAARVRELTGNAA